MATRYSNLVHTVTYSIIHLQFRKFSTELVIKPTLNKLMTNEQIVKFFILYTVSTMYIGMDDARLPFKLLLNEWKKVKSKGNPQKILVCSC